MANETKVTATETETETVAQQTNGVMDEYEPEERAEGKGVILPLHAKRFTSTDGKVYYSYFVPFQVYGQVMELEVRPGEGDINGYRLLKGIFDEIQAQTGKSVYELTCTRKSSKNEKTGKRMIYISYEVRRTLPNGFTVSVTVKPYGNSNKRMLEELYNQNSATD